RSEYGIVDLPSIGLQQGEFLRARRALGLHLRVFKERLSALIEAVEQHLVRPFEVEGKPYCLADARVGEVLAPGVEEPALCARRASVVNLFLADLAFANRGKIVLGRPGLGDELLVEGHVALLESLEGNLTIPEKLDSNDIKVVLAAA